MVLLGKNITKQLIYKFLGIFVVGMIVLGVATYIFLIQREKAQFAKAEKEIDALYTQIVQKVGKPDQEKKTKTCGYASRVYGRGPRSCGITSLMLYESKNLNESNKFVASITPLVRTKIYGTFGESEKTSFYPYDGRGSGQELSQKLDIPLGDGSCSINYQYPVVQLFESSFQIKASENLMIVISCGKPSLAEYFPVTKN